MFNLLFILTGALTPHAAPPVIPTGPEDRALAYLAREVPRWSKENGCRSCHNNGDAARALYAAVRLGRSVPARALADTTAWLERPASWAGNGGEGPSSDKNLARLQFAATLSEAHAAGLAKDKRAIEQAARMVIGQQAKDGSWHVVRAGTLGSPATHGNALATALARRTLQRADARRHQGAITRADAWLRKVPVDTVLDAAAMLLGLGKATDAPAVAQRKRCLALIRKGESRGGWGPYLRAPAEVFDTALVLLALAEQEQTAEIKAWTKRGRAHLLAAQEKDGSWTETTRPTGAESYAQRLSTTGWAALALLITEGRPPSPEKAP